MKRLLLSLLLCSTLFVTAQEQPKQCKGITVKNVQCKNRAKPGTEYCHLHNPDLPRCGTPTSKGQPCRNPVKVKGAKCWRHAGN